MSDLAVAAVVAVAVVVAATRVIVLVERLLGCFATVTQPSTQRYNASVYCSHIACFNWTKLIPL